jgi:hypothetical protein
MELNELQKGFALNTRKITKFVEGLSQEDAFFRPYGQVNSFIWNLGHIAMVRNTIIKILNPTAKLDVYEGEKELFGTGATLKPNEDYPAIASLFEHFVKRGEELITLLGTVSDEHLKSESSIKIGPDKRTNEDLIYFFYNHETEHLGEMKVIKNIVTRLKNA